MGIRLFNYTVPPPLPPPYLGETVEPQELSPVS